MRVIRSAELKHINVDTTVQTNAIRLPTDARLYHRCRERLVPASDPRSGSEYRARQIVQILLRNSDRSSSSRVSRFVRAAVWHRTQAALAKGILGSGKAELRLSRQETRAHRPLSDYRNRAVMLPAV
jgi:hypothetical protein